DKPSSGLRMLLFLLPLLFQPQGICAVNSDEDFRFCANRMQTEQGNIYYHFQKDRISITNGVNLNVSAPFPPDQQDSISGSAAWPLPEPLGSYRFCVYWFRDSSHFMLSYGSKNYSLSIKADTALCLPNRTGHSHQKSSYELHNVSFALAKGSYNISLPGTSDYQFIFPELSTPLCLLVPHRHLQYLESKLEEVKFQGHHKTFGEGSLLHASVWKFQSQDPQTFGPKMKVSSRRRVSTNPGHSTFQDLRKLWIRDGIRSTLGNPHGTWNTSGCEAKPGKYHTVCLCDHLTFFAVLMVSSADIDHVHQKYLTLVTYIGCIVSAMSSFLTIFFFLCLRKKQRDHIIHIHMNLLWAIFLLDMSFLIAVPLAPTSGDSGCKAGAMFLHFGLLACLTWMGIEGYNLYQLVVEVFISNMKQFLLKFCLVGWGLPVFIVALIFAIDPAHYGPYSFQVHDSPDGYTNATIREINSFLNLGFLSLVLFFNSIMLAAVVREILKTKHRERPWKYAVMLLGLSCVLGVPWGLVFFSFSSGTFQLVAVYLFTIINSLQGFLIFLWYLAKVMQTRRSSSMQCSTSNSLRPQSSHTTM
uniref:Adhesion G-protein coupled receptor G1 n=1 Tax=Salvator merianae TaxID=96440 RepID=A0A8D0AWF0_SALMN